MCPYDNRESVVICVVSCIVYVISFMYGLVHAVFRCHWLLSPHTSWWILLMFWMQRRCLSPFPCSISFEIQYLYLLSLSSRWYRSLIWNWFYVSLAFLIVRYHSSALQRLYCRIQTTFLTRKLHSSRCLSSIYYVFPSLCYLYWYQVWFR